MTDLIHAADMPIDEDIIAYICREILAGLAYLHSIGKVGQLLCLGHAMLGCLAPTSEPSMLLLSKTRRDKTMVHCGLIQPAV